MVIVLGDIGYGLDNFKKLPGRKKLLLGNHDTFSASKYLEYFDDIIGPIHYKKHWLAHFPVHEDELYGRKAIHGHTHGKGINDSRYINVCIEMNNGYPISFQDIKGGKYQTWHKVNQKYGEVNMLGDRNPNIEENMSVKYAKENKFNVDEIVKFIHQT